MADQEADENQHKMKYMSPEERLMMEKTKLKVKQHFQKFFRYCAMKKNKVYFQRWHAQVQFI